MTNLSVAVGRLSVLLCDAADDDLGRSYAGVDLSEEFVAAAHLPHVHPGRVAGRSKMAAQQLHFRLMRPLVAEEYWRRRRGLARIVAQDMFWDT